MRADLDGDGCPDLGGQVRQHVLLGASDHDSALQYLTQLLLVAVTPVDSSVSEKCRHYGYTESQSILSSSVSDNIQGPKEKAVESRSSDG